MQKNEEFIELLKSAINENGLNTIPGDDLIEIYKRAKLIEASSNNLDIELSKAINTLLEEIKKRGLSPDTTPQEISNYEDSPSAYSNKGFGWGYFWIVMGFIQGGLAFFLGFIGGIKTDIIPNRGVALLAGVWGISQSVGLLKRKIFGLYLVYATLAGIVLVCIGKIISGTPDGIIAGIIVIGIEYLWFIYFQKRKDWFTKINFNKSTQPKDTTPQEISNYKYSFTKQNKEGGVVSIVCPHCGFERNKSLAGAKEDVCPVCEKKYHQTTIKEFIENHKTFCLTSSLLLILVVGLITWHSFEPSNYDECILDSMKGVTNDVAAAAIRQSCRQKFPDDKPKQSFFPHFSRNLSQDDIAQISGRAGLSYSNKYSGNFYNGNSNVTLTQVTISISTLSNGINDTRTYSVDVNIPPLKAKDFTIDIIIGDAGAEYKWGIIEAKGY